MRTSTTIIRFQSLKDLKAPPIPIMSLLALHSAFLQKNLVLFIFIIHQIQLFAIILRTSFMALETTSSNFQWISERINKFFFLKDQASFDDSSTYIISTMTLITVYFLLVLLILAYMILVTYKKARLFVIPLRIWHLITLLHPYAGFFLIHVMLIQATVNIFDDPTPLSDNQGLIVFIKIYWIFLIICNFILSAFIRQFLSINLHTHDPLCIKARVINLFDLIYQTLMPILLIAPDPTKKLGDALIAINLICLLARDWTLYYYLPYYKFPALNIANIAQGIFTSTSFITIFGKLIIQGRDLQHPVGFILMICSLSNTFFVRIYLSRLANVYRKILIYPQKLTNPFHLIHYLQAYKFFSRNASINFNTSKTNQTFLYYIGSLKQTSIGYLIPNTHDKIWSFDTRKIFDKEIFKISIELLYNMIKKNPNMELLQATLADYYVQHKQAYIQASRFLLGTLKYSFSLQNTFYLVMIIILEKIKTIGSHSQQSLTQNVSNSPQCITLGLKDYLSACKGFHQIKNNVEKQLDLQLQYWKLFRSLETDFFTLVKLSQKVNRQAKDVHKIIKKSHKLLQNRVSSPSLLYSLYYCFLQNDLLSSYFYYLQYAKLESRKQLNQNIDAKTVKIGLRINSLYFLLSTADKKFGAVLDCSGGLMDYLQINKKTLLGHSLSRILPKGYGQWLYEYLQHFSVSSSVEASDKLVTIPLIVKEKYVELFNFHITVTYLSNHGLCFYGLFEKIEQENRLLLLKTNGEVLHYSENMEKDMTGLQLKDIKNICKACPEMNNVIQAMSETDQNNEEVIVTNVDNDNDVPDIPNLVQKHSSETTTTHNGTNKTSKNHFNTATKEADLVFFSAFSQASANSNKDLESITYKAEIRKQVFNGTTILEVKMNKVGATTLSPPTIKEKSPGILKTFQFPSSTKEVEFLGTLEDQKIVVDTLPTTNNNLKSMYSPLVRKKTPFKFDSEEYIGSAKIQSKQLEEIESISSMSETFDFDEKIMPPQSPSINPVLLSPTSERKQLMFTTRNMPPHSRETYRKISQENLQNDPIVQDNRQQSYKQNVNNIMSVLFKEYLENDLIIEGKDTTSISSTVAKQQKSVIRKLRSKQYPRSTKIYFITFLLYLVLLFCFLFWLNYYTSTTSKRIEMFSDVVQNTYFRNYRTKLTVRDVLYWQAVIQNYVVYNPQTTKDAFASSFYSMLSYNDLLIESLVDIDDDIQLLFYEKNVRIYNQDIEGDFVETAVDSTSQAILKLADRGFKLLDTESLDSTGENSFIGICDYFVMNGMNDLLIRTEQYIEAVKERLFNTLSDSSNLIQLVYILAISMIIAFMLISLLFIFYLSDQFKKFVNILYTITPQQVTKIELNLSKSKLLMKEYCQELDLFTSFDAQNKPSKSSSNSSSPQKIAHKNSSHESFRAANNTLSMRKFLIFLYILFFGLFVCVGLQLGFASIYYTEASNKIVVMKQQQVSLIAALSALDTYGMFNVALEMLIMQNGASKIKNNPSVIELESAVHQLDNIQSFQNSLTDENGDLPLYQQEILYNISCYNVDSSLNSWNGSTTASECIAISNGLTYTGLLKIFMQTESNIENFLNDYQSSSRNSTVLVEMYRDLWNRLSSYASTGNVLILLSFAYSTNSFDALVEDLGNRSVALAWVAGVVCIALGAVTWLFVIRRLSSIPFERKRMLALLPQKIIFNNFLLKKYVANLE